jgi:DnaJ-class molecular chaperone
MDKTKIGICRGCKGRKIIKMAFGNLTCPDCRGTGKTLPKVPR